MPITPHFRLHVVTLRLAVSMQVIDKLPSIDTISRLLDPNGVPTSNEIQ